MISPKQAWRSMLRNYQTLISSILVASVLFGAIIILRNERSDREKSLAREVDVLRYETCTSAAENRLVLRDVIQISTSEGFDPAVFPSFENLSPTTQQFFIEISQGAPGPPLTDRLLDRVPLPKCPKEPKGYKPSSARPTTTSILGDPKPTVTTSAGSPQTTIK